LFGIEYPIVSAGMGGVALSKLAAAVSEAGGLGTIALAGFPPEAISDEIGTARKLTSKPMAANLLIPFLRPGVFEMLAKMPISAVTLFWGDPAAQIPARKSLGLKVIWQCGSAAEALAAKRAGADAIIAQGFEAGGHVRGIVTTLALIPEVRDAIGDLPMIAAGGIADGRGRAAVLALGADGAVFGTRFVASEECSAHPIYKRRLLTAHASETVHTKLYDVGWPNAAHRVLRTKVVEEWENAGRPEPGKRPGEGQSIGTMRGRGIEAPLVKYAVTSAADYIDGDVESLPFYAGESVSMVREILPAGEIVRRIVEQARSVIAGRLAPLAR
ncbi:MAG TPA: nitronate monooxygenase, partial [Candidatus Acidoferrales bacterium]|nr:nitronate monooxygenase [Candidatus Acidoferrales bacterium]